MVLRYSTLLDTVHRPLLLLLRARILVYGVLEELVQQREAYFILDNGTVECEHQKLTECEKTPITRELGEELLEPLLLLLVQSCSRLNDFTLHASYYTISIPSFNCNYIFKA